MWHSITFTISYWSHRLIPGQCGTLWREPHKSMNAWGDSCEAFGPGHYTSPPSSLLYFSPYHLSPTNTSLPYLTYHQSRQNGIQDDRDFYMFCSMLFSSSAPRTVLAYIQWWIVGLHSMVNSGPPSCTIFTRNEPESPARKSLLMWFSLFLFYFLWYRWFYLQSRSRDTDVENKCMDSKRGRARWKELGGSAWHIYTIDIMYKIDN